MGEKLKCDGPSVTGFFLSRLYVCIKSHHFDFVYVDLDSAFFAPVWQVLIMDCSSRGDLLPSTRSST
jgi:hypothetical protein